MMIPAEIRKLDCFLACEQVFGQRKSFHTQGGLILIFEDIEAPTYGRSSNLVS